MAKISPLIKGVITGIAMLAVTLYLYYSKQEGSSPLQYLIYIFYAGGITWTLIDFSRSTAYTGKFGELFGQGFRCFIIVTLIMALFYFIFSSMHPEMAKESGIYLREELVKQKDKLPAEIDKEVETHIKQFTLRLVSVSVFGYLIMGAIFTAAGAGLLLMRRK